MTIEIEVREVYGEPKAYPVCAKAALFAKLAGTKTLTRDALKTIHALGVQIECVGRYVGVWSPQEAEARTVAKYADAIGSLLGGAV